MPVKICTATMAVVCLLLSVVAVGDPNC